jgi:hypothetical protein
MKLRRLGSAFVFALAAFAVTGCATDNPLSSLGDLDATAPGAPTSLAASMRGSDLVLTWDASADADVVGYDVYRYAPDPSRESAYLKVNGAIVTDTEYVIADAPSVMSWYRVKAVDNSSNASAASGALAAARPIDGSSDTDVLIDPTVTRASRP